MALLPRNLVIGLWSITALIAASVPAGAVPQRYVRTCLLSNSLGPSCPGKVEFDAEGSVMPRKLAAHELAPVALEIHGRIAMEGGGHPPALHEAVLDIDKGVAVDATGLPACRLRLLRSRGVAAARRLCRGAIVGSGVAHIGFASSETTVEAPVTLFNGGTSGGETRIFVHTGIAVPGPIPVVGSVKIQRKNSGLHTIWRIPRILEGDGSLLDFKLRIDRRFVSKGTEHSYLAAKCPDGGLRASFPKVIFRNDARTPALASTTVLKGGFVVPCSSGR